MNTANVKTLSIRRPKPSFTTRKAAHLNPIKSKMSKTAAEKYLPMVLQHPPVGESIQQYAIPLTGRMGNEDSVKEMLQICNKLDEYTKDLENVYGKKNGEVDTKTSQMERPFFSFLSTCDSAARELDTKVNEEHKILESLYQGYEKEAQLLEKLGEEDITGDIDIATSHDKVTALVSKLMEILHKLQGIKDSFQSLPKMHPQEHLLASPPFNTEKRRREAPIYGTTLKSAWEDHSQITDSVVRALQELLTDTDIRSREVLERISHDVGQLFDTQAIELQKLGKDQEETKNKYIKVKANYQTLLQEKKILETELKKLLSWKASQKLSPMITPSLEERLKTDVEPIQSAESMEASAIKQESEREVYRAGEKLEKIRTVSKSQDEELQEGAVPPADSSISTYHKKTKMQKKLDFIDISHTYDLDQGDVSMSSTEEPSDPDVREPKENGGPESKSVVSSIDLKKVPEGNNSKVKMKKQKSLKSRGKRLSKISSKAQLTKEAGKKSAKMASTSSEKLEDKSPTESKNQQDPDMLSFVSKQRKSATKLSRTPSYSGKVKTKLKEEDTIMATKPGLQSLRAEESMAHEQQGIPGGPDSPKSAGKHQGRQQSSKARLLSLVKEEKLANKEEVHKEPTGKLQVMNVILENQHEKQIASKKVHAESEPTINMEESRDLFTGLSKTAGLDQEGFSKDFLEHDTKDECVRSHTEQTDTITQYSGVKHSTETEVQEDTLPPYLVSKQTLTAKEAVGTQVSWVMDSTEMKFAKEDIWPHYHDTKKTVISSVSEFTQTDPSGTFDRTFPTSKRMDIPGLKEQTPVWQLSNDEDSHHDHRKDHQRSQPTTAAIMTFPSIYPDVQMPDAVDIEDICSKLLSTEKKHILWKKMQQSQEKYKNLAKKVTQADRTSEHQECLEIPDKAVEETAQSGNRLEPAMMKQFGEEVHMQIGQSPQRLEVTTLPLMGQSAGLQTEILKFHPPMIPSQQHQVRKAPAKEFLSCDNTFSQIFGTGLHIQGHHMSFTESLPTEQNSSITPSPNHPQQRAAGTRLTSPLRCSTQPFKRLFDTKTQLFSFLPLDEAKRTHLLYKKRVNRNVPMDYSTLPPLTMKGLGKGSTGVPSGKWNSRTFKENDPRKHPAHQTWRTEPLQLQVSPHRM